MTELPEVAEETFDQISRGVDMLVQRALFKAIGRLGMTT
jgi:hypothetical protein